MPKVGDVNICNACEDKIVFNGKHWEHADGNVYRHITIPRFKDPVEPIMPDRKFHERCDKIRAKLRKYEKQYRDTPNFKQVLRSELFGKIEAYKDCYNIIKSL